MERFWEVDFTRGTALVMMLASNFVTDLQYFAGYTGFYQFWWWFARITAFMFVFLVGVSLNISYNRAKKEGKAKFSKFFKRGLLIFCLGLIITAVTYLFLGADYIRFGVLHLIGISIILAYPFLKWKAGIAFLSSLKLIATGVILSLFTISSGAFEWLGLQPENFSTIDYFPLLPWFGVVLLGIYFSKSWYRKGERTFNPKFELKTSNPLCFLGRNTLIVYLIHQPIFVGILYALGINVF